MLPRTCLPFVMLGIFTGSFVTPQAAQATTVRYHTLRELVQRSDATVLGRSVGQRSFWLGGRIVTEHQVEVDESWVSRQMMAPKIRVLVPGGVVDGIGQRVDGAAQLPPHGRMVLHLTQKGDNFVPSGMSQGVWWVDSVAGPEGGILRLGGDRIVMASRIARPESPPDTLSELRRQVMEAASAP